MYNVINLQLVLAVAIWLLSFTVEAATIEKQPKSLSKKTGEYAQFTVQVSGNNLRFQWYKDGRKLAGAKRQTLILSKITVANAGFYYLRIIDAKGTLYTRTVNLSVNGQKSAPAAKASITKQPVSLVKKIGQYAQFTVTLSNVAKPQFQWYRNGQAVIGANKRWIPIPWVSESSAGAYSVTVAFPGGKLVSKVAVLKVKGVAGSNTSSTGSSSVPAPLPAENDNPSVPVISLQPISESVASGEAVTLNVIATGSGTLKYTWRKEGKTVYTSGLPSFTINAMNATHVGGYDVVVSDKLGSTTSQKAFLSLTEDKQATLSWDGPINRVDGSVLAASDIKAYRIYHLSSDKNDFVYEVPGSTSGYTIANLKKGLHYFSVTSIDKQGLESDQSETVQKLVQ